MFYLLIFLLILFAVGAAIASVDTTCGINVLGSLDTTKVSRFRYAVVYILFCTIGGALTGLMLAIIGSIVQLSSINLYAELIIIALFSIFVLLELINKAGILPAGNFIVPSKWVRSAGYRSAALWGNILGMGFITLQAGVLFHSYTLLSVLSGSWQASILGGVCFGVVRGAVFSLPLIRSGVYKMLEKRIFNRTALTFSRQFASYTLIIGTIVLLLTT